MGEASKYYEKAFEKAWINIQGKLESVKKNLGIELVKLERIHYDRDSYVSQIEELPDESKAAYRNLVRVRVGVDAVFRVIR